MISANHNKFKQHNEPLNTRRNTRKGRQAWENARDQTVIAFGLASDWSSWLWMLIVTNHETHFLLLSTLDWKHLWFFCNYAPIGEYIGLAAPLNSQHWLKYRETSWEKLDLDQLILPSVVIVSNT